MAFLDFLSKDLGGMAQQVNDPGGLGTSPGIGKTGMTYADLIGAAMKYGSKPGSSGASFGAGLQSQFGGAMQPKTAPSTMIQPIEKQGKQSDVSSISSILSTIGKIFGFSL